MESHRSSAPRSVVVTRGPSRARGESGRRRERAAGDLCCLVRREAEEPEHAFGVVDVGVLWRGPVEDSSHDREQGAAGGVQSDPLVRPVEAGGLDCLAEVAASVGPEGGDSGATASTRGGVRRLRAQRQREAAGDPARPHAESRRGDDRAAQEPARRDPQELVPPSRAASTAAARLTTRWRVVLVELLLAGDRGVPG
jgi:hypothetical protein